MRSPHRSWLVSGLLLLAACEDGTSTGNPTEEPHGGDGTGTGEVSNTGGGGNCKESKASEIAVDAQTALGFSAADILAFAEGTHDEKLRWNPQDFQYGPETGEHKLTLSIARKGSPRLVQYKAAGGGGGLGEIALLDGGGDCSDAIEIDVTVTIATDQGALNETFESKIVARNRTAISLYTLLDASKLTGSFAAGTLPANSRLTPLGVGMQLTKYGTQGSIRTGIETTVAGNGSGGTSGVSMNSQSRLPLANWGPEDCQYRGTPVPTSAVIDGFSGDDVITLLNQTPTANVEFTGSPETTATLSFSAVGGRACAALGNTGATIGGTGSLYVEASLRIKTADGKVDATWPIAITATPDANGAIERVQVTFNDEKLAPQGTLSERYGINGIDVSRFDSATVQLDLSVTKTIPLRGFLDVRGFTNTPCTTVVTMDANGGVGTSGCAGAMITNVAHAGIRGITSP